MRPFVAVNQNSPGTTSRAWSPARGRSSGSTHMIRLMPYLPGTAKIMEKVKAEIRDVSNAIELPETRPESRTKPVRNGF